MRIVFRTEGGHSQGMGDLWGSIALAEQCASDEVLFILSRTEEATAVLRGLRYSFEVAESSQQELRVLQNFRPDAIVVNKLSSDEAYIRSLKTCASVVVTIDDVGTGGDWADLRFNVLYHRSDAFVDPEYVALRCEFQEAHLRPRGIASTIREVLITQGGSDTYGFTPKIIRGLETMRGRPHCTVVVGPAFQHETELAEAVKASSLDLSLIRNTSNMAELMGKADVAVTAGGITLYELACIGTPGLVICGEEFEVETARRLDEMGVMVNLGFGGKLQYARLGTVVDAFATDTEKRRRMSEQGKQLVDGRGSVRIMARIRDRVLNGTQVAP